MNNYDAILKLFLEVAQNSKSNDMANNNEEVPIGVSNRHIHLCEKDLNVLFGDEYKLFKIKDLSQPGQYACNETLTICGPKGAIEKVRILGPLRHKTQVEVLLGDCFKLGISPKARLSGELNNTPGITLIGPKGSVQISEGTIVAQRHIHMSFKDAEKFGVHDGQVVSIEFNNIRGGVYNNVIVRATEKSVLECHIDIEEANAMCINSKSKVRIIK
ncbi:phosphate propanoyltransferase [Clostridium sp. NSJ-6]|uniref:Phosphate propanoyltransferase n=1 Tax=Clostridium hominis TaxID=2763036 RepID=A0ABR7DEC0_9CLOT|nr:phosphate propanoyltransferase [Clostridium hominis]MBC5629761.1 phosphate propanoyltransferase [Clostridium hominis]